MGHKILKGQLSRSGSDLQKGIQISWFKAGNKKSTLRVYASVRMTEVKISLRHVSIPMRARRHGELYECVLLVL